MEQEIQKAISLLLKHGYRVTPPDDAYITDGEFEHWWNMYNKKRGKDKCLKRWRKMTRQEREACISATPAYVRTITDKQYQKDPYTYLNGRCWNDEIITPYGKVEQGKSFDFATKAAAILNAD